MNGSVELAADGQQLVIRFQYRPDLVDLVKTIQGRRFDGSRKEWRVPAAQAERVYQVFSAHLFEFAPEVMSMVAGTYSAPAPKAARGAANGGPSAASAAAPAPGDMPARSRQQMLPGSSAPAPGSTPAATPDDEPAALTVSAFNLRLQNAIRSAFPEPVWVVGEIQNHDKGKGRGHRFFTLIEKSERADKPQAVMDVVLFSDRAAELEPRLQQAPEPFALADGLEVRVLVRADFHAASGRARAVVLDVDPTFTLGKLALARERLLRELRDRGLLDANRSLPLPVPPLRLAVLSSPDSDGWNDFLRHLQESGIGFAIDLYPVRVQGIELKPTVLKGLRHFAPLADDYDALCLVRGGGSRTDLAWFDDREIAFAVATYPLKVLVGIGHQRDESVLDILAHSEKTPTALAQFLVDSVLEARQAVAGAAQRLAAAVDERLDEARQRLRDQAVELQRAVELHLRRQRDHLIGAATNLRKDALSRLRDGRRELTAATEHLAAAALRACQRQDNALRQQAQRLRLLDPRQVLRRGFALLQDQQGRIVPSAQRLTVGQPLQVRLRDGRIATRIDEIHHEQEED